MSHSVQSGEKLIWVAISGEGNLRNGSQQQLQINNNISEWLQLHNMLCHTRWQHASPVPAAIHPGRICHCLHWIIICWLSARVALFNGSAINLAQTRPPFLSAYSNATRLLGHVQLMCHWCAPKVIWGHFNNSAPQTVNFPTNTVECQN